MKFLINKNNLSEKLNYLIKAISSNPPLPILNNFCLEIKNDNLIFKATDLQIGIKCTVRAENLQPLQNKIAIPAKIFTETIKNLPEGEISFEFKKNILKIKSKTSQSKITCQSADEFPEFPDIPQKLNSLDINLLKIINQYASFAVSKDQARLILTTLLFKQNKNNLEIVATDGFRLSVLNLKSQVLADNQQLLIPASILQDLEKVVVSNSQEAKKFEFAISKELKQLVFLLDGMSFFVRLIEGEFPPYQKIIPQSFEQIINFDAVEFADCLKQALVLAREASNIISLEFNHKNLKIKSKSSSYGEYTGEISISLVKGEAGEIAFNAKYLQDLISNIKAERLELAMNDKLKPARFREEGNQNFDYIVMPFRLNE